MSFTSVPILDLALSRDPATKPQFLADLRHALMEVGFLYLKNVGIPDDLWHEVEDRDEERAVVPRILAAVSRDHSRRRRPQGADRPIVRAPRTRRGRADLGQPAGAEPMAVGRRTPQLPARAISLPADAFNRYFDAEQQHKLKIVKYPRRLRARARQRRPGPRCRPSQRQHADELPPASQRPQGPASAEHARRVDRREYFLGATLFLFLAISRA
ncbi:hypothetical protein O1611_g6070 [Lasiodiplodia mahajangana]|uniref:Uncharacterized protein n=1 Tax=Lasiodiplodia mahajangana TaxID=1108764 RepID=A0ACC2JJ68_9PEZI|nr:hypothetical protein O1611_g6070 [Lasiodiplodia mahajangana]